YKGSWKKNEFDGYGILYYENGNKEYEGKWKNDLSCGEGTTYYKNGNKEWEGTFVIITDKNGEENSVLDGFAVCYYESGKVKYRGYFKQGWIDGMGIMYKEDGSIDKEGEWKDDKLVRSVKVNFNK
ncbi:MAG: hypothetical protein IK042_01580, partial [Bacteroidales bacterium]|nr:hypothetical protein [Bacteroidales bacterium]